MSPTSGALFAGYGGLDLAVREVFGAHPAWVSEIEPGPCKILADRFPGAVNLGDITQVDWPTVPPVDIITAGYPCQPFSHAGQRKGRDDDRHLWPYVVDAIAALRPKACVFENVQGHLTLGFDHVIRDLHQLGYNVHWTLISASSVGAPHRRNRLFILAIDRSTDDTAVRSWADRWGGLYRDPAGRGNLPGAPQGDNDGQGAASSGRARATVRGSGAARQVRDGDEPVNPDVDRDGRRGRGDRGATETDAPREGSSGGHRAGVPEAAPFAATGSRPRPAVERESAEAGSDAARTNPGGEPAGARPGAASAARSEATGGLPLGLVVGAGGRPVRAGGTPVPPAAERGDDRGSRVRDAWSDLTLLPSPRTSDTNGPGVHGDGGLDLRTAVTLLPTPTTTNAHGNTENNRGDRLLPGVVLDLLPTPTTEPTTGNGHARNLGAEARLLPTPTATDHKASGASYESTSTHHAGTTLTDATVRQAEAFGQYALAIARWEAVLGRPAPAPTEPTGKGGAHRLSPRFVEWLMGLDDGWVTGLDLTRNEQLKALGNGVVPQQAAAALRHLLGVRAAALAGMEVAA